MKIKEIRLENVEIYKNDEKVFEGPVENTPDDLKNYNIKEINFNYGKLIIEI